MAHDKEKQDTDQLESRLKMAVKILTEPGLGDLTDKMIAEAKASVTHASGRVQHVAKYIVDLLAKADRKALADDSIEITRKEKDGTIRLRKCARSDFESYKRKGYVSTEANAKKDAGAKKD